MGLNKRTKRSSKFSYTIFKSAIRPAAYSDNKPAPVLKESVLSYTEPSQRREETSNSCDVNELG